MTKAACAACRHTIDAAARVCPYCGADPSTGQKLVDTQAIVEEVFRPRRVTASESILEYARQRQGVVIGVAIVVIFLLLTALHQFVTARNNSAVSASPPVPLTEVTDLNNQRNETTPLPMPELTFPYDGRPQAMRTFIVEAGAVTPPEVLAAQAAAQPAAQPGQQQPQGARPAVPPAGQPGVVNRPAPTAPQAPVPPRPAQ